MPDEHGVGLRGDAVNRAEYRAWIDGQIEHVFIRKYVGYAHTASADQHAVGAELGSDPLENEGNGMRGEPWLVLGKLLERSGVIFVGMNIAGGIDADALQTGI